LTFLPETDGVKWFTLRTNLLNLLGLRNRGLIDYLIDHTVAYQLAISEFKRQLPPIGLNTYGARFEFGNVKPGYLPELTHNDSLAGYDLSIGGIAGSRSGVIFSLKKDISQARLLTAYYLQKIYDIENKLKRSPENVIDDIKEYVSDIAKEYPRMSMSPRISAFAGGAFVDGGTASSLSTVRRYSVLNGGVSASLLQPFRKWGKYEDHKQSESSAGFAGLLSASQLLVLPGGGTSSTATRLSAAVWVQDLVPYYVVESDPDVIDQVRYVFDHWKFRMGVEVSNKTRFDEVAPMNVFLRFRTLPPHRDGVPTMDQIRQDTQFTVTAGRAGDRSSLVSLRIDRAF
jgi:hypothetical protein